MQLPQIFSTCISLFLFVYLATGQTAPERRLLTPGASVERTLTGGEVHSYRIALRANEFASVQIVKQNANVKLTVKDPTAANLFEANFESLEHGIEIIALLAKTEGTYTLIVEPDFKQAPPGRYQITLTEPHAATDAEQQRFAAQLTFTEAVQLHNQGTAASRQESNKKLMTALTAWRSLGDKAWEARTLYWIGWNDFWLNQPDAALPHLNQSLALRRASNDNSGAAEILRTIGLMQSAKGQWQPAREASLQALELHRSAALEHWQLGFTLAELGKIYWRLNDLKKSDEYFDEAIAALRQAGDEDSIADTLTSRSFIVMTRGDYQSAYEWLQRTLPVFRARKDVYAEAAALNTLGIVFGNLGEMEKARDHLAQAIAGFRTIQDRQSEATALINLGIVERVRTNLRQALVHYNEALQIMRTQANRRGEANLLRHIGQVQFELKMLPQARESLNEALRLARPTGETLVEPLARMTLGEVYAAQGEPQRGLESLMLALEQQRAYSNRSGETQTLFALAKVERTRGNLRQAQTHAEAGIRLLEGARTRFVGTDLRAGFSSVNQFYYEFYIDLLMQRHAQEPSAGHDTRALQASEQARARALLESLVEARADIRQGGDPALLEREQTLQQRLSAQEERRLRILSGNPTQEQAAAADRAVEAALTEYQQVQAQIRTASPRYAALTQPQPMSLAEMQAQLDEETVLLVYSLGEARSFLWQVTAQSLQSFVLPPRAQIASEASAFYRLLQVSYQVQSKAQYQLQAQKISRLLLGLAAPQLTKKRLVVVADGTLQYIPFAALLHPTTNEPLRSKHEIVALPSISSLGQLRRDLGGRAPAPRTIAVIADPIFEMKDERFKTQISRATTNVTDPLAAVTRSASDTGLSAFVRLAFSRREADYIAALVPPAQQTRLLDFDASRATLANTDLSQYRILHFATHSLINQKHPELSGIVLSLYDRERHPQDGFLRTHEIYNLKLNADLVVLSACQTALGKEVRGEGLLGLSRGFLYAGAPRLVVSLWKVNDQATAELMRLFYRGMLRDGLRPAAALRAAQIAMAQNPKWAAPYYWAGFVLQGEWR